MKARFEEMRQILRAERREGKIDGLRQGLESVKAIVGTLTITPHKDITEEFYIKLRAWCEEKADKLTDEIKDLESVE